jgi:type I site-specific restriction endonuclease
MRSRVHNGKEQIFCEWRHRWVRLTPEEWVRQQLLHRLVEQLNYPASLIAVETAIRVGEAAKRCDAVIYDRQMNPLVLIECKAETVALTQKTLDQAITYNRKLQVPYLLLHNGPQTIFVQQKGEELNYIAAIPSFSELKQ